LSSFLSAAGSALLWIAAITAYSGLFTGLALLFVTPERARADALCRVPGKFR
jgi:hypothetical protein